MVNPPNFSASALCREMEYPYGLSAKIYKGINRMKKIFHIKTERFSPLYLKAMFLHLPKLLFVSF